MTVTSSLKLDFTFYICNFSFHNCYFVTMSFLTIETLNLIAATISRKCDFAIVTISQF